MGTKSKSDMTLNVLSLEDSIPDFEMICHQLTNAGYDLKIFRVEKEKEFAALLKKNKYDIILADFNLPGFDAFGALRLCNQICPDVPFICVSGAIGEEKAVELLKLGAVDYVIKDRPERLPLAIQRALEGVVLLKERNLAEAEKLKIWNELQVNQIELELQNQELIQAKEQASIAAEKYIGLYDFAPSGYFTISKKGEILELNLAGAKMLGKERTKLKNRMFHLFISNYSKPVFLIFLEKVLNSNTKESCELTMLSDVNTPLVLHLTGRASENGENFLITAVDITERKRAEGEAKQEQSLSEAIVDSIPGTFYVLDENGLYLRWNAYQRDEIVGKHDDLVAKTNAADTIHPDDRAFVQSKIANVLINGIDEIIEGRVLLRGGPAFRWLVMTGRRIMIKGRPCLVGIGIDITEHKLAEEALHESEEKFRNIFENAQEGIFQTNINGTYISVNPAFAKMFGFDSPEELIHDSLDISKDSYYDPMERDKFLRMMEEKGFVKGYEYEVKHKDGSKLWFYEDSRAVKDENDRIQYFEGFVVDITERKLAEEKQQLQITALNAAANAIVITNSEGTIEWVNSAFTTLTGYEFDEAIGKNPSELVKSGMHDNSFYQNLWDTILAGEIWRGETINRRKNGTLYNEMQTITPLIETDGKIKYFISIKEDITERKRAEQELTIAKERAEESDKLKTAFLQNMSHEIRTPLNGIIGFSRLLNSDNLSKEDIQEFTSMITVSGERLIEIVNNVLEMSKIQTGQVKIVSEPIVINSLLSDLYDFFSHLAEEKNISLNYHNTDDFGRTIYSDEGKLHQIFSNLINNSLKFTKSGSIDFGYDIIDNKIRFYVKDTGIGIPEDMHDKIFERFIQAELSISRNYEGAGLGLAICKGLVEFLGGEGIWLESEINKGTTFYFTLPYNEGFVQTQEDKENPENSLKYVKSKILIVEDDWVSSQYLIRFFEESNITVIHAVNGEQAVELVKITPDIDLILMDIKMPVMDGIEAAILIKQIRPKLPIIAQTAYAFIEEKQKILSAGFDDYISKPYDTKIMNALIDKYLKIN